MLKECLENVRNMVPLVHNITNYVTVNDVANVLLACGGSPIMSDEPEDVEDITSVCGGLNINIGTLHKSSIEGMFRAGRKAGQLGHPILLDPVGAGASAFRNETVERILQEVKISILRGNLSEVSYVAGLSAAAKGVDVSEEDAANDPVDAACQAARRLGCTVGVTGAVDIVTDGNRVAKIHNGHPLMAKVTGTGCMTSAITAGYAGMQEDMWTAATAGILSMGLAGEIAYGRAAHMGTGSFRTGIIDGLSSLNETLMEEMAKVEEM